MPRRPAAPPLPAGLQMKFHQCVRLASFERDRTISFIPPDGAFDLMCGGRPAGRAAGGLQPLAGGLVL